MGTIVELLTALLGTAPTPRPFPISPPAVPGYVLIQWLAAINGFVFVFAFGAIVGSFLNVVVYRLPKGLNLVTPPSACPHCQTRLTWRENIPVLGWLMLRGRCRFCRSPISPEYPIVEALVGTLFAAVFVLWFMDPALPGLTRETLAPEWALDGLMRMWPMALLVCVLLASLVAITLIDARTFTIPLSIPWLVIGAATIGHPLHALGMQLIGRSQLGRSPHHWTIPTPEGPWLAATLGASVGLVIANVLLATGVLKRSFADYEAWEVAHQPPASPANEPGAEPPPLPLKTILLRVLFFTGPAIALMFVGFSLGLRVDKPLPGMGIGLCVGLGVGVFLRRLVPEPHTASAAEPLWVQYPFARREMIRELAFLAPAAALALLAFNAADSSWLGRWGAALLAEPPLWLRALGGTLAGTLIGGGVVWGLRIPATLVLGKEAMGLGDVHLMAAVGAVLGWIDPVLAFFIAPFVALTWTALSALRGNGSRHGTALPYGPHLAFATVVVIFAKPVLEAGLTALAGRVINLP